MKINLELLNKILKSINIKITGLEIENDEVYL